MPLKIWCSALAVRNFGGADRSSIDELDSTTATANLDLRLVVGIDWKTQQERVIEYVRGQGYFVTRTEPTKEELMSHAKVVMVQGDQGENASRTPMELPIAVDVIKAVESARGKVILLPTSGATVPMDVMERRPGPNDHGADCEP